MQVKSAARKKFAKRSNCSARNELATELPRSTTPNYWISLQSERSHLRFARRAIIDQTESGGRDPRDPCRLRQVRRAGPNQFRDELPRQAREAFVVELRGGTSTHIRL